MNSREEIKNSELILKIMSLCIEIQNKEIATIFCDLSGHVTCLYVKIHSPAYDSLIDADYDFHVYSTDTHKLNEVEKTLTGIIDGTVLLKNEQLEKLKS